MSLFITIFVFVVPLPNCFLRIRILNVLSNRAFSFLPWIEGFTSLKASSNFQSKKSCRNKNKGIWILKFELIIINKNNHNTPIHTWIWLLLFKLNWIYWEVSIDGKICYRLCCSIFFLQQNIADIFWFCKELHRYCCSAFLGLLLTPIVYFF